MKLLVSIQCLLFLLLSQRGYSFVRPNLPISRDVAPETEPAPVVSETLKSNDPLQAEEINHIMNVDSRRMFLASLLATSLTLTIPDVAQAAAVAVEEEIPQNNRNQGGLEMSSVISASADAAAVPTVDWNAIFQKASKKALGGGKAGASAAVIQVFSLMWLRTSMNYQYRYGGDLFSSLNTLWKEGGIPRLYQGLPFALVQGPLTRFGDTAANVGILTLLESIPETQSLPLPVKTLIGSITAGTWRIILMPIDASKTAMQVEGADGLQNLWNLTTTEGPAPLYQGALASAAATAVGHFPWYTTYNYLNQVLPEIAASDDLLLSLARSAFLGFCSSCVSDVCSNSLRVIKTTKQTARLSGERPQGDSEDNDSKPTEISYGQVVRLIIEKDGIAGLFGRGLQTRLLTNSIQGAIFSVLWRYFQQADGV